MCVVQGMLHQFPVYRQNILYYNNIRTSAAGIQIQL